MLSKANYLGNIPSEFIYRDRIFRSARQKKKKKDTMVIEDQVLESNSPTFAWDAGILSGFHKR